MNFTSKFSKIIANIISDISTKTAYTSTQACLGIALEEPKIPKVLLNKNKAK
ncbi:AgrD family cyclic lactone autoinducer peptide [Clostridium estertheticum]|uniref:AgrD family cyclic lactone autoinducer peptide n=1 Tax=Clostridium estertheticum TaxID=238834 RepID=UPI00124EB4E0|nr:cyclic lactone autoinducer peptide [Clostridium estertheticum]MBZ9618524.1 cyclic lactone autoinducer peptide [Clostridium estertheticum subsp. laramiense]MCB2362287.1 cyclic lactone autoinducer peptide [Clostridium estertheticum]WAG76450.1 cyclic lactone autoinducer peptide [Clostridium estertheticum]